MLRGPSALLFPFSFGLAMRIIYFRTTLIRDSFAIIQHAPPYRPLLILISLYDHYSSQASFGLFLYRNSLSSLKLIDVMPPRPSDLNCYKTLSICYTIYATSTSILRCLLGHLLLYNFQRLLLGSLFPYHFH